MPPSRSDSSRNSDEREKKSRNLNLATSILAVRPWRFMALCELLESEYA